jgi:ADP-heptose:LPS heptosyltransferase
MHRVEHNLSVAEAVLNCKLPHYPLFFMPAQPAVLPPQLQDLPKGCYAVIHLGTGGNQPCWIPTRFAEVCNYLAQKYHLLPVLSGTLDDRGMAEKCLSLLHVPFINLVGQVSIVELAEVLRRARMLISVDTGVVHLAAAVGTPCVTMYFRKDNPPSRWFAWQVPNEVVTPLHYCVQCTQCCRKSLSYPLTCISSLRVEQVLEAVDQLIKRI